MQGIGSPYSPTGGLGQVMQMNQPGIGTPTLDRPYEPVFTPEQFAQMRSSLDAARAPAAEMVAGALPGIGDVMSVRDMVNDGRSAIGAYQEGNTLGAVGHGGMAALGGLGALPFVPNLAGVIKAFHGSPHKFDKFSMDGIGTGTKANTFGKGFYFSESPEVARSYQEDLSRNISVDGSPLLQDNKIKGTTGHSELDSLLMAFDGDIDLSIEDLSDDLEYALSNGGSAELVDGIKETLKRANSLKFSGSIKSKTGGSLYEVTLEPEHADLLNWDAPLREQSPKVQGGILSALKSSNDARGSEIGNDLPDWLLDSPGREALKLLGGIGGQAETSLNKAGIPGISFLHDRYDDAKDGTRNIVMFDDKLINIDRVE